MNILKIKNHVSNPYSDVLERTNIICLVLSKREISLHNQMYDLVVMPIKVWTEEDFPNLLQVFIITLLQK